MYELMARLLEAMKQAGKVEEGLSEYRQYTGTPDDLMPTHAHEAGRHIRIALEHLEDAVGQMARGVKDA